MLSQFMTVLHLYDVDNKSCINLQETTRTTSKKKTARYIFYTQKRVIYNNKNKMTMI